MMMMTKMNMSTMNMNMNIIIITTMTTSTAIITTMRAVRLRNTASAHSYITHAVRWT